MKIFVNNGIMNYAVKFVVALTTERFFFLSSVFGRMDYIKIYLDGFC